MQPDFAPVCAAARLQAGHSGACALNPYVLHLTDYSPNRESPLNNEIQESSSEAQIRKLFAAWKQQVFVGGWKEVGPAGP